MAHHNWPMISATDRLRLKPWRPVEQNAHSSAQPTWEETHSVPRSVSGMNTVSMPLPVPTDNSHLRVPSVAVASDMTDGGCDHRAASQIGAQVLGEIAHALEIGLAKPVDPAHHLSGAQRLLADFGKETDEPFRVEVQQIDGHQRE